MRRRNFLGAGGAVLAGLLLPLSVDASGDVRIRLFRDMDSGLVGFDPTGLFVEQGTRVIWENGPGVHTVTAYHPDNGNRALRIPETAEPWDSGYLMQPGETFSRRFTVPGVYDYFCIPHERAGMAGRIVVGEATGPGARPYGEAGGESRWQPVPAAVRRRLPAPERILETGRIAHGGLQAVVSPGAE